MIFKRVCRRGKTFFSDLDTCPDNSREIPMTPVLHPKYQPYGSGKIVCYRKKLSSKLYGENCRLLLKDKLSDKIRSSKICDLPELLSYIYPVL